MFQYVSVSYKKESRSNSELQLGYMVAHSDPSNADECYLITHIRQLTASKIRGKRI